MMRGNLGPGESRRRLFLGIGALVAAGGAVITRPPATGYGWSILFVLFWLAGLGLFQAKEKT